MDGSHTPALKGVEEVDYQGRKKRKTTNSIYLTDRQGLPLAISSPKAGNHHDLHQIRPALDEMFNLLESADISLDGLFVNADSGFDAKVFRLACAERGIFANVDFNTRNGEKNECEYLLDDELYKERYSIERTNAWMVTETAVGEPACTEPVEVSKCRTIEVWIVSGLFSTGLMLLFQTGRDSTISLLW
jgi:hypothetical protein